MIQEQLSIEDEVLKYSKLKSDLLKIVRCIDCCTNENEKEMYQNIALEYSKGLKSLHNSIQKEYQITFCSCCYIE